MSLDREQKRLITGTQDGSALSVWNFNNGQLLKRLIRYSKAEDLQEGIGTRLDIVAAASERARSMQVPASYDAGRGAKLPRKSPVFTINSTDQKLVHPSTVPREIRSIICIDRITSPPKGTGRPMVQKFIVCVGFDRRIFVFDDNLSDKGDVQPMLSLPLEDDARAGHCHTEVVSE